MAFDLYQEQILDHYKHPRNKGVLDPSDFQARDTNPLCGDEVTLYLRTDGLDRITEVRYDGQGCAISQASASMLTVELQGRTVDAAKALGREDLLRKLGIPLSAARLKCALLPFHTLRRALGLSAKDV